MTSEAIIKVIKKRIAQRIFGPLPSKYTEMLSGIICDLITARPRTTRVLALSVGAGGGGAGGGRA